MEGSGDGDGEHPDMPSGGDASLYISHLEAPSLGQTSGHGVPGWPVRSAFMFPVCIGRGPRVA